MSWTIVRADNGHTAIVLCTNGNGEGGRIDQALNGAFPSRLAAMESDFTNATEELALARARVRRARARVRREAHRAANQKGHAHQE